MSTIAQLPGSTGRAWKGMLTQDPLRLYSRARAIRPVAWSARLRSHTVFTYAAVKKCFTGREFGADHPFRVTRRALGRTVLDTDGEVHRRIRSVLAEPLHQAEVAGIRQDVVRPVARAAVKACLRNGGDLRSDVADVVPMQVLMSLLGLPAADVPAVYRLTRSLAGYINQESMETTHVRRDLAELQDYLERILFAPGSRPPGPVGAALTVAVRDGRLSRREGIDNTMLLLVGGTETTSCALASTMGHIFGDPELRRALRAEEADLEATILEILRLQPPVRFTPRFVVQDTELAGVELHSGEVLNLCIVSANRDEAIYRDAEAVRFDRGDEAAPFTFGRGAHSCFGAFLGQTEVAEVIAALLDEPDLFVTDDPARLVPSWTFRRPARLRFAWTAA